jgi:hypothetical protein
MKTIGITVLAAAVAVAAAAFLSVDSHRGRDGGDDDAAALEIRGGGEGGRLQLIPVEGGAAGPESVAFDGAGAGPYAGVSDGRVLRWLATERRWVQRSSLLRAGAVSAIFFSPLPEFVVSGNPFSCNLLSPVRR